MLCFLVLQFERVVDDTCDSQIADVICNSLNYAISLNILYTMLFYQFFYYTRVQKYSIF
jgi:hypothetical protein